MNISDIAKSARGLCTKDVVVPRGRLFSSRGIADRSRFPDKIGKCIIRAVNVKGGENSIIAKVTDATKKNIYAEDTILSEHPEVAKKVADDFKGYETFCCVEEYCEPISKRPYFKISCVSKTFCGARFAICKDLMHVYTDTVRGIKGADALFNCAMKWNDLVVDEDADLDEETTGFYHAIEVMFPWLLRICQFEFLLDKFKHCSVCAMKIAKAFMVPVRVVEHICTCTEEGNDLPYCGFSHRLNSKLRLD